MGMKTRRGAAGMQYAMVVGLIGVVVIVAIAAVGTNVKLLMTRTGNVLLDAGNGIGATVTPSSTPSTPAPPPAIEIKINGTGRSFTDNTYATSCKGYFSPPNGYAYSGATGDGVYTIRPATTAFDVTCSMSLSSGGWTRIGSFNGTSDTGTLAATRRNEIPYTDVLLSENPSNTVIKTVTCHTTPQTGFAADNTSGYNCTASGMTTTSIRVMQAGYSSTGNYGIYQNGLLTSGGCSWSNGTLVWGRHYQDGAGTCVMKGNGEPTYTTVVWNATTYSLWVR